MTVPLWLVVLIVIAPWATCVVLVARWADRRWFKPWADRLARRLAGLPDDYEASE